MPNDILWSFKTVKRVMKPSITDVDDNISSPASAPSLSFSRSKSIEGYSTPPATNHPFIHTPPDSPRLLLPAFSVHSDGVLDESKEVFVDEMGNEVKNENKQGNKQSFVGQELEIQSNESDDCNFSSDFNDDGKCEISEILNSRNVQIEHRISAMKQLSPMSTTINGGNPFSMFEIENLLSEKWTFDDIYQIIREIAKLSDDKNRGKLNVRLKKSLEYQIRNNPSLQKLKNFEKQMLFAKLNTI